MAVKPLRARIMDVDTLRKEIRKLCRLVRKHLSTPQVLNELTDKEFIEKHVTPLDEHVWQDIAMEKILIANEKALI